MKPIFIDNLKSFYGGAMCLDASFSFPDQEMDFVFHFEQTSKGRREIFLNMDEPTEKKNSISSSRNCFIEPIILK